jgi:muramoyltetrapeptide carboxypeptidase
MRPCQLPQPLQPGDLLHIIAPSGALREREALENGMAIWRDRGYRLALLDGYDDRWGYLAGTDAGRQQQLVTALQHPESRGILCVRGGWGAARLIEHLTLPTFVAMQLEPKWLVGFSDITSLLWALSHRGIAGLHGPVLTTIADEPDGSLARLFDCVQGKPLQSLQGEGWSPGQATGLLLPANLTVATHLLGTGLQPDLAGVILAIEDVGEAPYRIDRMLTHWRMTGALDQIAGIAIGRFSGCEPPAGYSSFSVAEVLRDRLIDLGVPIVAALPFGHDGENATLPVGVPVVLDGDVGLLKFA